MMQSTQAAATIQNSLRSLIVIYCFIIGVDEGPPNQTPLSPSRWLPSPLLQASIVAAPAASQQLGSRSEVAQHSGLVRHPGVGRWGAAGHRPPALQHPPSPRHGAQHGSEPPRRRTGSPESGGGQFVIGNTGMQWSFTSWATANLGVSQVWSGGGDKNKTWMSVQASREKQSTPLGHVVIKRDFQISAECRWSQTHSNKYCSTTAQNTEMFSLMLFKWIQKKIIKT